MRFHDDIRIAWGQCDPAGIVYFPRYSEMLDNAVAEMFRQATGMHKRALLAHYGIIGFPVVTSAIEYKAPCRFGDEVRVETEVERIGGSSFDLLQRIVHGDGVVLTARMRRVWAADDGQDGIRGAKFPADLAGKLNEQEKQRNEDA